MVFSSSSCGTQLQGCMRTKHVVVCSMAASNGSALLDRECAVCRLAISREGEAHSEARTKNMLIGLKANTNLDRKNTLLKASSGKIPVRLTPWSSLLDGVGK